MTTILEMEEKIRALTAENEQLRAREAGMTEHVLIVEEHHRAAEGSIARLDVALELAEAAEEMERATACRALTRVAALEAENERLREALWRASEVFGIIVDHISHDGDVDSRIPQEARAEISAALAAPPSSADGEKAPAPSTTGSTAPSVVEGSRSGGHGEERKP